ncbi:hypothetical protein AB0P17_12070 [Streptomyces sp. NPDC088124]|uniref:hypothetical protein n=1 Tax=Streptomyces sp. NPDC088124 TaxID=3154654 RepID=UPI00342F5250
MRRRLKFAAVLVVVVLALTGFSSSKAGKRGSGSKGKSSSSGSSSGGGCSNSKKSNGSSGYNAGSQQHAYDNDNDDNNGSSGGTYDDPTPTPAVTGTADGVEARIVTCVRQAKGKRKAVTYATVRVETAVGAADRYDIDVTFTDATGRVVDSGETEVDLEGGGTTTVRVAMDSPRQVSRVRKCAVSTALDT